MNRVRPALCVLAALLPLAASGCFIRVGPKRMELRKLAKPPVLRLGTVEEKKTGSWATNPDATGFRLRVTSALTETDAASLFSNDPSALPLDLRLTSSHEDDAPRLILLGCLSIGTLGLIPLPYHSEWNVQAEATVHAADDAVLAKYPLQATGTYDIWALPLTMFTLLGGSFRGPSDGRAMGNRVTNNLLATLVNAVEADYPRLAYWKESRALIEEQEPIAVPLGPASWWARYDLALVKPDGAGQPALTQQYLLCLHSSRPHASATPQVQLVLGERKGAAPWSWRDPQTLLFVTDDGLWVPDWKTDGPLDRLTAVAVRERTLAPEEVFRLEPFDQVAPANWNRFLIAWKNRQLPALLRDAKTPDLRSLVDRIEALSLRTNETAEKEKDEGQKLTAAGKPGAEFHAQTARTHVSRLEILKTLLAALKQEIANRSR